MSKNPAFQFYPSDWTRDLDDQDLEIEGAWIRICCRLWWSPTKGQATKNLTEWSYILRTHPNKTKVILKTLLEKHIATGEYLDNQNVTIISRRMVRDYEISKIRREVGKLGGNPGLMKIKENLDNLNPTKTASLLLQSSTSENDIDIIPPTPLPDEPRKNHKIEIPPTIESVTEYCLHRNNNINPKVWWDSYAAKGWMIGKSKMVDWEACVRTWEQNRGGSDNGNSRRAGKKTGGVRSDDQPFPCDLEA